MYQFCPCWRRCIVFFSFLFLILEIGTAQPPPGVVSGRLIDSKSKLPVAVARVFNVNHKNQTLSDTTGCFSLNASAGDTLHISCFGYFFNTFVVTDSVIRLRKRITIPMLERMFELEAVNIIDLGTYEQFKQKVLNTILPEEKVKINPYAFKGLDHITIPPDAQAHISLGSPVTALYMWLSKEGKSIRKLEAFKEKEAFAKSISDKYSAPIVSGLTGYKDAELEQFMVYCKFDDRFLQTATEYEIAQAILERQKRFEEEKASGKIQKP